MLARLVRWVGALAAVLFVNAWLLFIPLAALSAPEGPLVGMRHAALLSGVLAAGFGLCAVASPMLAGEPRPLTLAVLKSALLAWAVRFVVGGGLGLLGRFAVPPDVYAR